MASDVDFTYSNWLNVRTSPCFPGIFPIFSGENPVFYGRLVLMAICLGLHIKTEECFQLSFFENVSVPLEFSGFLKADASSPFFMLHQKD